MAEHGRFDDGGGPLRDPDRVPPRHCHGVRHLGTLWDLCPPRQGPERFFIRVPERGEDTQAGPWILHLLKPWGRGPRTFTVTERETPFKREVFVEFVDKQLRYEGLSMCQQAGKGQYLFFPAGGDCFMNSLQEATTVSTRGFG